MCPCRTRELGRDRALRRLYPSVFPFISTWRSLRGLNNKIKLSPKFLLRLSQLVLLPLSCSCKTFSTYREILILNLIQLMCSCNWRHLVVHRELGKKSTRSDRNPPGRFYFSPGRPLTDYKIKCSQILGYVMEHCSPLWDLCMHVTKHINFVNKQFAE